MSYHDTVSALAKDAEQLEQVYKTACEKGEYNAFKQAIDDRYTAVPDNLLYAAWFYRLKQTAIQVKASVVSWSWAVPLAIINGFLFWLLSDDALFIITIEGFRGSTQDFLPVIALLGASITAVFVLIYLTAVGRKSWRLSILIAVILLAAGFYVLLTYPQTGIGLFQEQYLILMMMHLPLLAWAGVGGFLIARHRDAINRFHFLIKSLEIVGVGGLVFGVLVVFTGITASLFVALDVDFPETVARLFLAGGAGLITVVVPAVLYNPTAMPAEQSFEQGFHKLVSFLMRALLPLTLLVLIVYLIFIPFNFRAPFDNREVLIIYNVMLFAVVALLVGSSWVNPTNLSAFMARWLRRGIIAVAALTLLVGLYALAAILYRTAIDRITPNRFAFIGWNVVNIGLLLLILIWQFRVKGGRWLDALYRAFSAGTVAYAVWTLIVILAIPWLFGINEAEVETLPVSVQRLVYEQPAPILLKCSESPHIYLLDGGEKRWIDTIETFNERGYVWRDVHFIACEDLSSIADGEPIPADAGPPPKP